MDPKEQIFLYYENLARETIGFNKLLGFQIHVYSCSLLNDYMQNLKAQKNPREKEAINKLKQILLEGEQLKKQIPISKDQQLQQLNQYIIGNVNQLQQAFNNGQKDQNIALWAQKYLAYIDSVLYIFPQAQELQQKRFVVQGMIDQIRQAQQQPKQPIIQNQQPVPQQEFQQTPQPQSHQIPQQQIHQAPQQQFQQAPQPQFQQTPQPQSQQTPQPQHQQIPQPQPQQQKLPNLTFQTPQPPTETPPQQPYQSRISKIVSSKINPNFLAPNSNDPFYPEAVEKLKKSTITINDKQAVEQIIGLHLNPSNFPSKTEQRIKSVFHPPGMDLFDGNDGKPKRIQDDNFGTPLPQDMEEEKSNNSLENMYKNLSLDGDNNNPKQNNYFYNSTSNNQDDYNFGTPGFDGDNLPAPMKLNQPQQPQNQTPYQPPQVQPQQSQIRAPQQPSYVQPQQPTQPAPQQLNIPAAQNARGVPSVFMTKDTGKVKIQTIKLCEEIIQLSKQGKPQAIKDSLEKAIKLLDSVVK